MTKLGKNSNSMVKKSGSSNLMSVCVKMFDCKKTIQQQEIGTANWILQPNLSSQMLHFISLESHLPMDELDLCSQLNFLWIWMNVELMRAGEQSLFELQRGNYSNSDSPVSRQQPLSGRCLIFGSRNCFGKLSPLQNAVGFGCSQLNHLGSFWRQGA